MIRLVPVALVRIHWLTSAQGGRERLPPGPSYASTAHFAEESPESAFSVVLRFDPARVDQTFSHWEVELTLLAPEKLPGVAARLKPGVRLTVTEGPRPVAHGEVYGVRMVESDQLPVPFSPERTNFRPGQKTAS